MATVTTSTQIDTINVLDPTTSIVNTDLFLIQRGLKSFKLEKQNLILPINQIDSISNNTVIGNVTNNSTPEEVSILDEDDLGSDSDTAIATQQSIKAYVDATALVTFEGTTSSDSIAHGLGVIPDIIQCKINGKDVGAFNRANGTDGGRYFASVKATSTTIEVVAPGSGYGSEFENDDRVFTAIVFN